MSKKPATTAPANPRAVAGDNSTAATLDQWAKVNINTLLETADKQTARAADAGRKGFAAYVAAVALWLVRAVNGKHLAVKEGIIGWRHVCDVDLSMLRGLAAPETYKHLRGECVGLLSSRPMNGAKRMKDADLKAADPVLAARILNRENQLSAALRVVVELCQINSALTIASTGANVLDMYDMASGAIFIPRDLFAPLGYVVANDSTPPQVALGNAGNAHNIVLRRVAVTAEEKAAEKAGRTLANGADRPLVLIEQATVSWLNRATTSRNKKRVYDGTIASLKDAAPAAKNGNGATPTTATTTATVTASPDPSAHRDRDASVAIPLDAAALELARCLDSKLADTSGRPVLPTDFPPNVWKALLSIVDEVECINRNMLGAAPDAPAADAKAA